MCVASETARLPPKRDLSPARCGTSPARNCAFGLARGSEISDMCSAVSGTDLIVADGVLACKSAIPMPQQNRPNIVEKRLWQRSGVLAIGRSEPRWPRSGWATFPSSRRRARADERRPGSSRIVSRSRRRMHRQQHAALLDIPHDVVGALGGNAGVLERRPDPPATWPAASPRPAESGPAATIGPMPGMTTAIAASTCRSTRRVAPPRVNPRCRRRATRPSVRRARLPRRGCGKPPKLIARDAVCVQRPGGGRRGRRSGEQREDQRMRHWRYVTSADHVSLSISRSSAAAPPARGRRFYWPRTGARVAIVDGSHPREKPCGGGLSARALDLLRPLRTVRGRCRRHHRRGSSATDALTSTSTCRSPGAGTPALVVAPAAIFDWTLLEPRAAPAPSWSPSAHRASSAATAAGRSATGARRVGADAAGRRRRRQQPGAPSRRGRFPRACAVDRERLLRPRPERRRTSTSRSRSRRPVICGRFRGRIISRSASARRLTRPRARSCSSWRRSGSTGSRRAAGTR